MLQGLPDPKEHVHMRTAASLKLNPPELIRYLTTQAVRLLDMFEHHLPFVCQVVNCHPPCSGEDAT